MSDAGGASRDPTSTPAQRLWQLWRQGQQPDVRDFLAGAGGLPPEQVAAVLLVDQRERWQLGERVSAEAYLQLYPHLRDDFEYGLELVYGEFLLAEDRGEAPDLDDYLRRFPHYAERLRLQVELHRAVEPPGARTFVEPGPAGPTGPWPGVAGYEVLREVGRGGMGVVYQARHLALNRLVALKMIRGWDGHVEQRQRFKAEAEAVARLQHPNVVQIHEVGEHDGCPYMALEYLAGASLASRLAGTPQSPRDAAELVRTLARAVHAAHQCGVVHRDLKPANILLAASGSADEAKPQAAFVPKITDFGLAKHLDADAGLTRTGDIVGTPSYMAPEQAEARPQEVGPGTDTYALGAILYECLTGRPPFKGATLLETLEQVRSQEPVPPRRLQPKVMPDLETICLKCLRKEPHRRYATAAALADDLGRFLAGEPIRARPVGWGERLAKWARRRPAIAALLVGIILVTALGLAGSTWQWLRAEDKANAATAAHKEANDKATAEAEARRDVEGQKRHMERLLYDSRMNLAQRDGNEGRFNSLAELLEATLPERMGGTDLRGFEWYYWQRRSQVPLQTFVRGPASDGEDTGDLAFSPDGRRLAWGSWDTLTLWDPAPHSEPLTFRKFPYHFRVSFHPDGRRLAYGGLVQSADGAFQGEVRVLELATGRDSLTLVGNTACAARVAFSSDGRWLAASGWNHTVQLWDAASGRPTLALARLPLSTFEGPSIAFSPDGRRLAAATGDVEVWDTTTGEQVFVLHGHTGAVHAVAFSPDGSRLATAGEDRTVRLWEAVKGGLLLTLREHGGAVTSVAFSPDGTRLASSSTQGMLRLWNVANGQELFSFRGHPGWIGCVTFSPDGTSFASRGSDGTVRLWDVTRYPELARLHGARVPVTGVSFRPDGKRLASAGTDGRVKLWDGVTGELITTLVGPEEGTAEFVFSQDGGRIARLNADRTINVWDGATGMLLTTLAGHTYAPQPGEVQRLVSSPDGQRLASFTYRTTQVVSQNGSGTITVPGELKLWDVATGKESPALPGADGCLAAAFSPDRKHFAAVCRASGDRNATVLVWDLTTWGKPLAVGGGEWSRDSDPTFSPDGRWLAVPFLGGTGTANIVKLWDREAEWAERALPADTAIAHLTFSPNGAHLAAVTRRRWTWAIHLWDVPTARIAHTLEGHAGPVSVLAWDKEGRRLASVSHKTVKVWDPITGQELLSWAGHDAAILSAVFSPDGQRLATAGNQGSVEIWGAAPPQVGEPLVLEKPNGPVTAVHFSPDGRRLASTSWDGTIRVRDVVAGKEAFTCSRQPQTVWSVVFSPDGRRLASASGNPGQPQEPGQVKVWDATTGKELFSCPGHTAAVCCVAFRPDGRWFASAGADRTVKLWDAATGQELRTLRGHTADVWGVAFSPDGNRLATASHDHTVRLWDAATGQQLRVLEGHSLEVWSVAFSADGERLVSTSDDLTVKVWDAHRGTELFSLSGHTISPYSAAFSPDGRCIASASGHRWQPQHPGEVILWDVAARRPRLTFDNPGGGFFGVAFSPRGDHLAAASLDQSVKVWRLERLRLSTD